ncbi:MAG: hypothetical protein AAF657_36965, partial [Acidobacteriota bacterium]
MIYLLQHTAALGLLVAILWLPGIGLERSWASAGARLRPLTQLVFGIGFWIVSLFFLATCQGLRPWVLGLVIAAVIGGSAVTWVRSMDGPVPRWPQLSAPVVARLGLLAAVLAPFFFLALSPPVSWDASAYHLRLARLYAEHGGFREAPFNVYSYWPLNVQLLFAMVITLHDYVLAKLLHFAFGVATLYALFLGGRTYHRPASGFLACLFFLANGVVAYELRVAYVDLAYA